MKSLLSILICSIGLIFCFLSCEKQTAVKKPSYGVPEYMLPLFAGNGKWEINQFIIGGIDSIDFYFVKTETTQSQRKVTFTLKEDVADKYHLIDNGSSEGFFYFSENGDQMIFAELSGMGCESQTEIKLGESRNIFIQVARGESPWTIEYFNKRELVLRFNGKRSITAKLFKEDL